MYLCHAAREVDLHERVLGLDLVDVLVLLAVQDRQEVLQLRDAERFPLQAVKTRMTSREHPQTRDVKLAATQTRDEQDKNTVKQYTSQ